MGQPIAIISLELGALVLYWLVIVVVESAVLQMVAWGDFRQCLKTSLFANLISALALITSLVLIPRFGFGIIIAGGIAVVLIESTVLSWMETGHQIRIPTRRAWLASGFANLVSYILLILPVYWYAWARFQ